MSEAIKQYDPNTLPEGEHLTTVGEVRRLGLEWLPCNRHRFIPAGDLGNMMKDDAPIVARPARALVEVAIHEAIRDKRTVGGVVVDSVGLDGGKGLAIFDATRTRLAFVHVSPSKGIATVEVDS